MQNAEKIVDKIKSENIEPRPAWVFTAREWGARLSYLLFLIAGSISFSIILFAVSVQGFDLLDHAKHSALETLLVILPVLWLAFLVVFLGASVFSVLFAGRSYKYSFGKWLAVSTGLSMTLGTLFFITGGAGWLENQFETHVESYESLLEKKTSIWSQPELGTLSGEITEVYDEYFMLNDWKNQSWKVETGSAFIAPVIEPGPGVLVKITGRKSGNLEFVAEKIRPWGGAPGQCKE